jgi:hypothetical protein
MSTPLLTSQLCPLKQCKLTSNCVKKVVTLINIVLCSCISSNPHPIEVISIDHLPTLLPRESSEYFAKDLLPTLLELKNRESSSVWQRAEKIFKEKCALVGDS